MQEYVEERTIAISVKAAKLSGKVLAAACKKVFAEIAKQQEAAKRPKGRQSVRKLMNHHVEQIAARPKQKEQVREAVKEER